MEKQKTEELNLLKFNNQIIMKNILAIYIVLFSTTITNAQLACSKYYPLKEGTTFEITTYDKKDKVGAVVNYEVKNATLNKATMVATISDDKGKEVTTTEYDILCTDKGISIDFKSLMSADYLQQYKDMEIDMTGTNLEIPNNLSVGQSLPDANMDATIKVTPINMKMSINMVDRKVESKETITTPAGTFDCIVISYSTEFKMGLKRIGTSKQWMAEGVGVVKTEEYNKSGKLVSYTLLTKLNK
jgi:hypothetical protein